jgi:2-polyprenyl-3-methyl-5-hydroxy-6-metoxy-1,4-benzoquinol methylase
MGNNINIQLEDFEGGQQRSHLFRYYCARGFVDPGDIVVDFGCGYGYGSSMMAKYAKKVIGIDRDDAAIKYATEHYQTDNCFFMQGNVDQMDQFPQCDVITCIECFEHLRFPEIFANKAMAAARKKIIITCPIVPTKHEDPTHLNDFTESQVDEMFRTDTWGSLDSSLQGPYMLGAFVKKHE